MAEDELKDLREKADAQGEEAVRLLQEAEQLHRAADLIDDEHEHHEAMKQVHTRDIEAVARIRESNEFSRELIQKQREEIAEQLHDLRNDEFSVDK